MTKRNRQPRFARLYTRLGISSLSAKLLIPVAILMVINLIISIFAFNFNTRITQDRLMGQQLDADASRIQQGFQQRLDTLLSAAVILANDPVTIQNTPIASEEAISQLSNRAVSVRERFDLDMVQIYDANGTARVNLVPSVFYYESFVIQSIPPATAYIYYADKHPLILIRKDMQEEIGSVIVGFDLDLELDRLMQQYRLASEVNVALNAYETSGNEDDACKVKTGLVGDDYIRQYELQLADHNACILLSRPTFNVQHVLRSGLYIMIANTVLTLTLLAGLLIAITTAITKPIRKLSDAAQAVARGDLTRHVTAHEVSSLMGIGFNDELSLQAQAFNRMVSDLNTLYTQLEERVANRTRELSVTSDVARAIAESRLNLHHICRAVSVAIQRQYSFDLVGILRYNEDQNALCLIAGAQKTTFDEVPDGSCVPVNENTLLSSILQAQEAHVSQIITLELGQYLLPNMPRMGSYAAIPIRTGDKVYGLLYAQHHLNHYMSSEITTMLQNMTGQIAIGFENVELYTLAQQARDAAQAANQAKGQFLAHMSHELRTPMNAILGFTQVLLRSDAINGYDKEHLEIIYRSGEHLMSLINDVLDMSKIEAGRSTLTLTNFDLFDQLAELELMFRMRAENAGLELKIETAPETPRFVRCDQSKFRQVLINLLGNAVKFTKNGKITTRIQPVGSVVTITSPLGMLKQQRIRFEVIDTGPGIAPGDQERIFEAFVQTGDQTSQGTGLGLPISREFVRMMGGELVVRSSEGKGSTFAFELELQIVSDTTTERRDLQRIVGVRSNKPLKILVADDNPANRHLITEIMRGIGLASKEVENGQQAIDIARSWMPDLIWMDLHMPVINGNLAAQRIRDDCADNNLPTPVIIALTATDLEGADNTLQWCDGIISKPFHDYKLYNTMQDHLDIEFLVEKTFHNSNTVEDDTDIYQIAQRLAPITRSKLESAITRLDMTDIEKLISDIAEGHPILGRHLQNLAASFDYDTILQLIRHTEPDPTIQHEA